MAKEPVHPGWNKTPEEFAADALRFGLLGVDISPPEHAFKSVRLQFSGWGVVLRPDGTWFAEETCGG